MANFIFPLRARPSLSYKTEGREFRANRSGGRKHAACDLIAPKGTEILAMEDGQVIQSPYPFYSGTYALEIKHDSGMVVRYGEISQAVPAGITAGARVSQGQVIARVGQLASGSSMLHLEIYQGTKTGPLTQTGTVFKRRSDLVDPTPFLEVAPLFNGSGTVTTPLAPNQGRVNNNVISTLNVRSSASPSSTILFTLSPGVTCTVLKAVTGVFYNPGTGDRNDWYEIQVGSKTGFVAAFYLDVGAGTGSTSSTVVNSLGRVNSRVLSSLNVRSGPATTNAVVFTVSPGDTFTIIEEVTGEAYAGGRTDWCKIEKDGTVGFAAGYYININEEPKPENRWDFALPKAPTNGASAVTAKQDNLPPGISSSEKMAQTDLNRVKAIADRLRTAAVKHGIPPALMAALASRESRCGNVLDANGWGDRGNAFGILQVDKRFHSPEGTPDPTSLEHIEQATGILVDYLDQIEQANPSWEDEYLLKGAVVAYNAGVSTVKTKNGMDIGSTGDDYGSDVIARAKFYLNHADLPMFRT